MGGEKFFVNDEKIFISDTIILVDVRYEKFGDTKLFCIEINIL